MAYTIVNYVSFIDYKNYETKDIEWVLYSWMGNATAAWWLVFGLCFLRSILVIVLIMALKNFWDAVKKEDEKD